MDDWLSPGTLSFATAILIVVATLIIGFVFNRFMKRYIKKSALDLDNDPTNYQFLRRAIATLIYLIGFSLAVYSVPSLKTLAQSMLAGAGNCSCSDWFCLSGCFV